MKSAIITGADGFVGSNTARCFAENGVDVLALDVLNEPRRLVPGGMLSYKKVDVSNASELIACTKTGKYDTFVHFAWAGSAGQARTDYHLQMKNAINTVSCLKAAKEMGCSRFVCAGSIMEREVEAAVHAQGSKPGMGYIYGMGKHIAHCLCKAVAAEIGIDLVWALITNAYGEGELSPRFVNTTLRKIIRGEPLQFTAATQNYDFVHAKDVAMAFYLIAENGKPFYEYVIGSGHARPLREFITEVTDTLTPGVELKFGDVPFKGQDLPLESFSTFETERDCGFLAEINFAEGARRTLEWLRTVEGESE